MGWPNPPPLNYFLLAGGIGSLIAAALHVGIIFGGPSWYRFFGAGEKMANMAEAKNPVATVITLGIAGVLAAWGYYGVIGADLLSSHDLPFLGDGILVIGMIYALRGLVIVWAISPLTVPRRGFWIWSSLICLALSSLYITGIYTGLSCHIDGFTYLKPPFTENLPPN